MQKLWIYVVIIFAISLTSFGATANSGDFIGGVAIGTGYAGVNTAPTNGLIVQGAVGIGTTTPTDLLDVAGALGLTTTVSPPAIGLYAPAANTVGLSARSLPILEATNPASAVNFFSLTGGATGSSPTLAATGSDTNVNLLLTTKGSGQAKVNALPVINKVTKQVFTASGTYTPTTGMAYVMIECVGSGGGSGGVAGSVGNNLVSGGGGGGGYCRTLSPAATVGASQTVTIGSGGVAGSAGANDGGAGGDSSVGSLCIAKGGSGGGGSGNPFGGIGGVAGTGDLTFTGSDGQNGTFASIFTVTFPSPAGGGSYLGGSARGATGNGAGVVGKIYGGGAGGAHESNTATNTAGSAGASGVCFITEYVSQ